MLAHKLHSGRSHVRALYTIARPPLHYSPERSFSPSFSTIQALGLTYEGARALLAWSPVRWVSEGLLLAELRSLPPGWNSRREFLMWQCKLRWMRAGAYLPRLLSRYC